MIGNQTKRKRKKKVSPQKKYKNKNKKKSIGEQHNTKYKVSVDTNHRCRESYEEREQNLEETRALGTLVNANTK